MSKGKFKVGQKVRVLDGREIKCYRGSFIGDMERYVGKVLTVRVIEEPNSVVGYGYRMEESSYIFDERGLEPVHETIVIYRKDSEVIALDKRTGKKAVAKCSPADEFDFNIGSKLAFERLLGNEQPKEIMKKYDSIRVGDVVKCVDEMKTYDCYDTWDGLGKYVQNFVEGASPVDGELYKVLKVGSHGSNGKDIALIQNPNTTQVFIIGMSGIEKV